MYEICFEFIRCFFSWVPYSRRGWVGRCVNIGSRCGWAWFFWLPAHYWHLDKILLTMELSKNNWLPAAKKGDICEGKNVFNSLPFNVHHLVPNMNRALFKKNSTEMIYTIHFLCSPFLTFVSCLLPKGKYQPLAITWCGKTRS